MASNPLSGIAGLGTSAVEYAVGFGLGVALGRALGPLATTLEQEAYAADPSRALDPELAARVVAQALEQVGWGENEAGASGINPGKFDLLAELEIRAPAVGELLDMLRRGTTTDPLFVHGLRKAQLDPRYDDAIRQLQHRPLEGAELANAIHRGNMEAHGLLIAAAPTTPGAVPQYEVSPIDPLEQAAWAGISKDQLGVLVANAGLPLALHEMLSLLNRNLVTADDVQRAIAHSNIRNEYMGVALELRRRLLTPHDYAELQIRGQIGAQERDAGAALSGMEPADAELLYRMLGRAGTPHAVTTGLARGGKFPGSYENVPEPWRTAIERSNTIESMAELAYANRFGIPSYFVVRAMLQSGGITEAEAADLFKQYGYEPGLSEKAAAAFAHGSTGTGKNATSAELEAEYEGGFITEAEYRADLTTLGYPPHVVDLLVNLGDARRAKRYREKVVDAIAGAYVSFRVDDSKALAELGAVHVTGAAAQELVQLWQLERLDTVRNLTPAQVRKAVTDGLLTHAQGLAELEWQHYTAADAEIFLSE